jgi:hypothetical protein
MGAPKKYKKLDILQAIKGSGSIVSTIAKRLDCTWDTAKTYINSWPETIKAMKDEEETVLDMAESAVFKSIQDGNTQDAKWLLSTKGKRRGFSDKQELEISGPGGTPLTPAKIEIVLVKPDAKP